MRNCMRKFSMYLERDFKGEIKGKGETIFLEILVENFTQLTDGTNLQMLELALRPKEAKIKINSQLAIL